MNPIRQATYTLLAQIFLAPPSVALLAQLSTLPPFDSALQGISIDVGTVETYQVYYQELFGFNFFPYESLFHDHELMVNTPSVHRVVRLMESCGFDPTAYAVGSADHIGVELALMAHLIAQDRAGFPTLSAQATLIHQHLATWVPIAMLTMQAIAPAPLFKLVAEVTLELILSEVTHISATDAILWIEETDDLPPPQADKSDEEGLSMVIRQLITPVASGLFLTRAEIRAIGRHLSLPTTMGDRFGMLKQLFEAAGQFEQVEPLLTALEQHWHQTAQDITALIAAAPAWASYGEVWLSRLSQGQVLLVGLRTAWQEQDRKG